MADADPTTIVPDPPARTSVPTAKPGQFRPTGDLDGLYFWLGPSGAASWVDSEWDSTVGADASIVRVSENAPLALIGGSLGASRWTVRGGGRVWVDALAGTRIFGKMVGLSAGPIVEFAELAHPRVGASVGIWAFLGVAPYARIGSVQDLGTFAEIGIHIALPVYRR